MEVIINYYGEEYPCFIYPDITVKDNKEGIAEYFSLDVLYVNLQFGDEILEDAKMLSEYNLTYHCHLVLLYDNPNILLNVKYMEVYAEIEVDSGLTADHILQIFLDKNQTLDPPVDITKVELHFQGQKIDLQAKIADLGIAYGDTVEMVQPVSIDLESQLQEYKNQVEALQTELVDVKQERDRLKEEVVELRERVKQMEEMKPKTSIHTNPFERHLPKTNPFAMDENNDDYLMGEEMPENEGISGIEEMETEEMVPQIIIENEETADQEETAPEETAEEIARREKRDATRRARREARQAAHEAAKAQPIQRGIWEPTEEDKDTARKIFVLLSNQDEDSMSDAVTGWCWDQGFDDASIAEIMRLLPVNYAEYDLADFTAIYVLTKRVEQGHHLPETLPSSILQVMTEIRGYSPTLADNSMSHSSDSSSYSDYSYSDYSDYYAYSYSDYGDESESESESDSSSTNTPIVSQHAFKRYRPSFKQQPSTEPSSSEKLSDEQPSNEQPSTKQSSQKEGLEKTHHPRKNSGEKRVSWKLTDMALQKLTTEVFPRVAEGDTAPVTNVRTLFEQAGIPAGIMTSTLELVSDSPVLTSKEFAVVAFLLQRYQQGVKLPRHLPLPLRSLLPVTSSTQNLWQLSEKKKKELHEQWEKETQQNEMTQQRLKNAINEVAHNMTVTKQILKLIRGVESKVTEKEYIVGLFMAQQYKKGAHISPFLPTELKSYLYDSMNESQNQYETPIRRSSMDERLQEMSDDASSSDSSSDTSIGNKRHSNSSLFNSRLVESIREKDETPVYRKPSFSVSSVHSSDSHSSKVSRSRERRTSQDELSTEQALKSIQSPFTPAPIPQLNSSSDAEPVNE